MIKKITIEIAGQEIELSWAEALELHKGLNKIFPEPLPQWPTRPWVYWTNSITGAPDE